MLRAVEQPLSNERTIPRLARRCAKDPRLLLRHELSPKKATTGLTLFSPQK